MLRPSLPSDEELAAQSWMKKRTKLRTLAAQPTPPNAFCKTRVPTKRLAHQLLCSLPTWRAFYTQRFTHIHSHMHARALVAPKSQLQGMVHPTALDPARTRTGSCTDALTCESVDRYGLTRFTVMSRFPKHSTQNSDKHVPAQTIHPPPSTTSLVTKTPSRQESVLIRNVLTYTHKLRIRGEAVRTTRGRSYRSNTVGYVRHFRSPCRNIRSHKLMSR